MTIFQDKLVTRTYCDEAGDYAVPNVLNPRDLVFRPDLRTKTVHRYRKVDLKQIMLLVQASKIKLFSKDGIPLSLK